MPSTFVYFDLGNVILNFDHGLACENIGRLIDKPANEVRRVIFESDLQHQYEKGLIDDQAFHAAICDELQCECELTDLKAAASDIFKLNVAIVPLICALRRQGNRVGILSNTCAAHWEFVTDGRYAILPDLFEVHVLSYEVHSMKPEREIYDAAVDLAKTPAEDIFFMDDRAENVEGATAAGLNAFLYTDTNSLARQMAAAGLPV